MPDRRHQREPARSSGEKMIARHQPSPAGHLLRTPIPGHTTAAGVLQLQRLAGNRAVGRLLASRAAPTVGMPDPLVQRTCGQADPVADPGEFITHFANDPLHTKWISNDAGQCAPSAKAIGALLAGRGYTVSYRGIVLVTPPRLPRGKNSERDEMFNLNANNLNHFVVVVNFAGGNVVVDPTQAQFVNGSAQVVEESQWLARLRKLRVVYRGAEEHCARGLVYDDFATFAAADQYAGGGAMRVALMASFGGVVLRPYPAFDD
ncbi:MAG TPA: hypothetical protein VM942_11480 [Acidimicrobiales bacterium]|nr:hypothetical protein [Acidimicrobiales bacterium]